MIVLLALLAACSGSATEPTRAPAAAATDTAADDASVETESETAGEPAELEPAVTEVTDQPEEATSTAGLNGRNEDGTFYRGAADAPVTIIEYSDFL
jgi:hypothetical protein